MTYGNCGGRSGFKELIMEESLTDMWIIARWAVVMRLSMRKSISKASKFSECGLSPENLGKSRHVISPMAFHMGMGESRIMCCS